MRPPRGVDVNQCPLTRPSMAVQGPDHVPDQVRRQLIADPLQTLPGDGADTALSTGDRRSATQRWGLVCCWRRGSPCRPTSDRLDLNADRRLGTDRAVRPAEQRPDRRLRRRRRADRLVAAADHGRPTRLRRAARPWVRRMSRAPTMGPVHGHAGLRRGLQRAGDDVPHRRRICPDHGRFDGGPCRSAALGRARPSDRGSRRVGADAMGDPSGNAPG